jgi:hypothetical protein
MQHATKHVDITKISLPTDGITLGAMRRAEPHRFERRALEDGLSGTQAVAILLWEYMLADKAFAQALGGPDPHPNTPRSTITGILDDAYRTYGISNGTETSFQLIRRIEAAAADQAQTLSP